MNTEQGIPLIRESGLVLVMETPKGRGVFAGKDIPANVVLEVCPVLVLDPTENELYVCRTELYNYTYNWPYEIRSPTDKPGQTNSTSQPPKMTQAVILGLGSLFNHSNHLQNVGWIRDVPNQIITYKTLRDIKRGEELCISYGDRLTFVDIDAKLKYDAAEEANDILAKIEGI